MGLLIFKKPGAEMYATFLKAHRIHIAGLRIQFKISCTGHSFLSAWRLRSEQGPQGNLTWRGTWPEGGLDLEGDLTLRGTWPQGGLDLKGTWLKLKFGATHRFRDAIRRGRYWVFYVFALLNCNALGPSHFVANVRFSVFFAEMVHVDHRIE